MILPTRLLISSSNSLPLFLQKKNSNLCLTYMVDTYIRICLYEQLFETLSNTSDFLFYILCQILKSGPGIISAVSNSIFTAYFLVSPVATDCDLVGFYAESMMTSLADFMPLLIMIFHASLPQSRRPYDGERLTEFFQKKN